MRRRLDDPAVVAVEYSSEERRRRRVAAFRPAEGGRPDITTRAISLFVADTDR